MIKKGIFKTLRELMIEKAEEKNARLCEVDGQPAFFHRWVDDERAVLQFHSFTKVEHAFEIRELLDDDGIVPSCAEIKPLKQTFALVEMMNGSVKKVAPEKVRFCDREEAE